MKLHPYIKIRGANGENLTEDIESFTYRYSEENDDECNLRIYSSNPKLADIPYLQEGSKIQVEWGYTDNSEYNSRTVYIFDTTTTYNDSGITLELICHEKFTMTKINKAGGAKGSNSTSKKDTQVLILGFDVLEKLNIAVEAGNPELVKLLNDAGIKIESNSLKLTTSGWVDSSTADIKAYQSGQNVGLGYSKGTQINQKAVNIDMGMDMVYHNTTIPSYRTLRKYLDKLPGGPYVIDSRDDSVTIRTRDFSKKPVKQYSYKGENGELLDFTPETKNREYSKGSSRVSATGWDAKRKKAYGSTSSKNTGAVLADGQVYNDVIRALWNKYPQSKPIFYTLVEENAERAAKLKQQPSSKSGKAVKFQAPTSMWENIIQEANDNHKAQQGAARAQNERAIKNIREKLGAKGPYTYEPEEVGEGIQTYEPWEKEGRKPARMRKNGGHDAAVDETYVFRRATAPKLAGYDYSKKKTGTPEEALLTGNEGKGVKEKVSSASKNLNQNRQLDNNPATARVVGNPYLECGQIITILNVADKHAGNYYIKEVEHQIGPDGYITNINSMTRQGTNKNQTAVKSVQASSAGEKIHSTLPEPLMGKGVKINGQIDPAPIVNTQVGPKVQEGSSVGKVQPGDTLTVNLNSVGNIIKSTLAKDV